MWPAIAALGGAVVGALTSKDSNEDNQSAQEAFAQHGIRWKVADAKAAGLHPLYALGGSGATYTPSSQPIMTAAEGASLGQNLARAATGATDHERQMQQAQLEAIKAATAKDQALAAAAHSEAARNTQQAQQSKPLVGIPYEAGLQQWMRGLENDRMFDQSARRPGDDALPIGAIKVKPSEQVSARAGSPHLEASRNPFWQEYEVAPGFRSLLPRSSDPSESLENLSIWNIPGVIEANTRAYGPSWLKRFLKEVYGVELPTFREQMQKNLPPNFRSLRALGESIRR